MATKRQIRDLATEAAQAGDEEMRAVCLRALMGERKALAEVDAAIEDARAASEGE